jgi:hypothetical protein
VDDRQQDRGCCAGCQACADARRVFLIITIQLRIEIIRIKILRQVAIAGVTSAVFGLQVEPGCEVSLREDIINFMVLIIIVEAFARSSSRRG